MKIKILGIGCPNCKRLKANARVAVDELGIKADIEDITDMKKIMGYGIMSTPGLVVDEKVVSYGKVPSPEEIKRLLK